MGSDLYPDRRSLMGRWYVREDIHEAALSDLAYERAAREAAEARAERLAEYAERSDRDWEDALAAQAAAVQRAEAAEAALSLLREAAAPFVAYHDEVMRSEAARMGVTDNDGVVAVSGGPGGTVMVRWGALRRLAALAPAPGGALTPAEEAR